MPTKRGRKLPPVINKPPPAPRPDVVMMQPFDSDAECPAGHVGRYRKYGRAWRCLDCNRERMQEVRDDPDTRAEYNAAQRELMRKRRRDAQLLERENAQRRRRYRIRRARRMADEGKTRREIAAALGVSASTVARWISEPRS